MVCTKMFTIRIDYWLHAVSCRSSARHVTLCSQYNERMHKRHSYKYTYYVEHNAILKKHWEVCLFASAASSCNHCIYMHVQIMCITYHLSWPSLINDLLGGGGEGWWLWLFVERGGLDPLLAPNPTHSSEAYEKHCRTLYTISNLWLVKWFLSPFTIVWRSQFK